MKTLKPIQIMTIALMVLFAAFAGSRVVLSAASKDCVMDDVCRANAEKGQSYFKANDLDRAIEYFLKTVNYDPDYIRGMTYLGISYCKKGEKRLASKYLGNVVRLAPGSEDANIAEAWMDECSVPETYEPEPYKPQEPQEPEYNNDRYPEQYENTNAPVMQPVNVCAGKTVKDLWSLYTQARGFSGWHNPHVVESVVDGDMDTGLTSGYGQWKNGSDARDLQNMLYEDSLAGRGAPALQVDLETLQDIGRIVIGRPQQQPNEGDGGPGMGMSLWVSKDGTSWEPITIEFHVTPGGELEFFAEDFRVREPFRYIQMRIHSLGFYKWNGNSDSQIGISEIQCFTKAVKRPPVYYGSNHDEGQPDAYSSQGGQGSKGSSGVDCNTDDLWNDCMVFFSIAPPDQSRSVYPAFYVGSINAGSNDGLKLKEGLYVFVDGRQLYDISGEPLEVVLNNVKPDKAMGYINPHVIMPEVEAKLKKKNAVAILQKK